MTPSSLSIQIHPKSKPSTRAIDTVRTFAKYRLHLASFRTFSLRTLHDLLDLHLERVHLARAALVHALPLQPVDGEHAVPDPGHVVVLWEVQWVVHSEAKTGRAVSLGGVVKGCWVEMEAGRWP